MSTSSITCSTLGPTLPVELFHLILHNLRSDNDLPSLKQCALVCRTLRYIVQQHLFSEIVLHRFPSPTPSPRIDDNQALGTGAQRQQQQRQHRRRETLCASLLQPAHSHLLTHIRHLVLQPYPPQVQIPYNPDPSFLSVLIQLPAQNIHKLTLLRRQRDDPCPDTELIVRKLLRRCTELEELCLEDRKVHASYLVACVGRVRVLRVLGNEFVDDVNGGGKGGEGRRIWPRLETLVFPIKLLPECLMWMGMGFTAKSQCTSGRSGSDVSGAAAVFPRLKDLLIGDEAKEDVEVVNGVLDMCKSTLQSLVYTPYGYNFSSYPKPCYNQNGSKMELNIPPTLRALAINCPIMLKPGSRTYPNPFGWLNHTFRQLSQHPHPHPDHAHTQSHDHDSYQSSSLQIVHIKFLTTPQIEKLDALFPGGFPVDKCFHEFDALLSDTTRFPYLEKVYLTVGRHYLKLFADKGTLPMLSVRGMLGVIYEQVNREGGRRFYDISKSVERGAGELPWDGKTYSFSLGE